MHNIPYTRIALTILLASCGSSSERAEYPSTASTDPSADEMGLAAADA